VVLEDYNTCGHPLTVRHILLDCIDLQDVQRRYFSITLLRDLFESVDNRAVIDFIKEIHYYSLTFQSILKWWYFVHTVLITLR